VFVAFLGYFYAEKAEQQNKEDYIPIAQSLDDKLVDMSFWTDPVKVDEYIKITAERLGMNMDKLHGYLADCGVDVNPLSV
jgi:hypothetical protein